MHSLDPRWRAALAALALAAPLGALAAGALNGKVERVIDGDRLVFVPDGGAKPLDVRLKGIDAPEPCQDGGAEARAYLQDFVRDKPATLVVGGKDPDGRTLGVLTVDGLEVNQRLVAEGHAWSLRTKWNQGPYVSQEKVAIALKRGLRATPGAVSPWDFRRTKGACAEPAEAASAPGEGR